MGDIGSVNYAELMQHNSREATNLTNIPVMIGISSKFDLLKLKITVLILTDLFSGTRRLGFGHCIGS